MHPADTHVLVMEKQHVSYCLTEKTACELVDGLAEVIRGCDPSYTEASLGQGSAAVYAVVCNLDQVSRARDFAEGFFYALSSRP